MTDDTKALPHVLSAPVEKRARLAGKLKAAQVRVMASRATLMILRETGQAMTSQKLAACILQRYGRPIEKGLLKKARLATSQQFPPSP